MLFFTELWERFSFYGMKTLLVLYMINHFFWSQERASHLLGMYAALAYGLPVVGGFIADRWLGAKRAVVWGGILLTIGHFLMAFEAKPFFYSALVFIIMGVGLLKPNVSTQVGALYKPDDPRRDGAFTIFYMGINLGALIGPLLCDWLRVQYGYHYGFAAAGVGMVFGLIVYVIGQRKLVEFRQDVIEETAAGGPEGAGRPAAAAHPPHVVRDRVIVLLIVFAFVILFWTAFEQSPNAMLVWADKHTNLRLLSSEPAPVTLEAEEPAADDAGPGFVQSVKDWFSEPTMTSGQTQSFNPFFIITLAPVFAFLWVWLHKRGLQPSTPTKMAMGLALVAVAFGVMWPAAHFERGLTSVPLAVLPPELNLDEDGRIYSVKTEGTAPVQQKAETTTKKDRTADEDSSTREAAPASEVTTPERVYYGATRLRYNQGQRALEMNGVLTDLDRFRLLAQTAPADFVAAVESFAARTAKNPSRDQLIAQVQLVEVVKHLGRDFEHLQAVSESDPTEYEREVTALVQDAAESAEKIVSAGWSLSTRIDCAPEGIPAVAISEGEGNSRKVVAKWDPETKVLTAFGEIKERSRIELLAAAAKPEFKVAIDRLYIESGTFRVSVWWLILFFMVLTMGELCLSPVGLSLVTKLAPAKHVGLCMGGWFLATAAAEYTAQVFGAFWGKMPPGTYFVIFVIMCGAGAVLLALLIRPLKKMMHGVH